MGVYWDILSAVQTEVMVAVANTVIRRKAQVLSQDLLPMCIVCPGAGGEQIKEQAFGLNVVWKYPVLVLYVQAGNRQLTTGLQTELNTREAIRNQCLQTLLSGAVQVWNTVIMPEEAIKFQEYVGTNYDVSGLLIEYWSKEQRIS